MSDDIERAFRESLQAHAADAPARTSLAREARTRVARRRRVAVAGVAAAALAVVLGGVAVGGAGPAGPPPTPDVAAPAPERPIPDGWRWESYGGVEVAVPGDWVTTNGTQMIAQWCVGETSAPTVGFVGRPGGSTLVGCPEEPGPTLGVVGPYVSFEGVSDAPDRPAEVEGDVATVVLDGVTLRVQADEPLRERILATVRSVAVDTAGCPTTDPISRDQSVAPAPAVDVTTLTGVRSISACRYALAGDGDPNGSPYRLLSSLRLSGDEAADVVAAIGDGEPGGGPSRPESCSPDYHGDEALVLHIRSDAGTSRVHAFYSGCRGIGFDDGVRVYALTEDAIRPLLAGPNAVNGSLTAGVARIVWGD